VHSIGPLTLTLSPIRMGERGPEEAATVFFRPSIISDIPAG
jgi:hypothetical protein